MAGLAIDSGKGAGRRTVDVEVNMIPMIDLLMVTISFLLLTAVWTQMSRVEATAQVPGSSTAPPCESASGGCPDDKVLHVDMRADDHIALEWKQGAAVVRSRSVPRNPSAAPSRAPNGGALAAALNEEWSLAGVHRERADRRFDHAVLHTENTTRYAEIVAVLDAIYSVERPRSRGERGGRVPAFSVALAEK